MTYRGEPFENLVPDLIVDDRVIAAAKDVEAFGDMHVRRMIGRELKPARPLNFSYSRLRWKRIVREIQN